MFFTEAPKAPRLYAAHFSPHGYRPKKNTRNAKQAEYKSIWCQEYMAKILDTVVKVKLHESNEEGLCVSSGFPFQCSTQIIVHFSNVVHNVLIIKALFE